MSPILSSRIAVHRDVSRTLLRWISIGLIGLLCVVFTSCGSIGQVPTTTRAAAARSDTALFPAVKFRGKNFGGGVIWISGNLGPATVGQPYNAVLSVSGGSAPYHFSISTGALPQGLSLDPRTGTISGIPSKGGTFDFTVVVTDHRRLDSGEAQLEIVVSAPNPVAPVNVSISPVSATIASGAKLQFKASVQNTSNTAVAWSASSGTVSSSGLFTAPAVTTTKSATLTATSMADANAKASATISVSAPAPTAAPLTITTSALPAAETGVSYKASVVAQGGTPPYGWSVSAGSLPQALTLDSTTGLISGSTSQSGTFTFTVMVTDSASQSAGQTFNLSVMTPAAGNYDGPAELPRTYVQSAMADTPVSGQTIFVNAGSNLQTAINSANCGDIVELQAGATFTGLFTLPAKACDDQHWIIIRTSAPDTSLPPEGTRLTPCYAGVVSLPGRPPFHCSTTQNLVPKIAYPQSTGSGPITLASGANHYRLLGLEITRVAGTGSIGALMLMQKGGTADHIVIDRVWLHGTAQDETGRGVHLNGMTFFSVIDSYFSDFHCISVIGACTDAQDVVGGSGMNPGGPYKIVNNFLEASGESILFGGGPATTTPTDIEIRRNHFFKPLQWMPGAAGFVGSITGNPFIVKNHFELKNAQRVLLEGNVLENDWGGFSQHGFSILLTPRNQYKDNTNVCPICQVTDVTIRFNTISHVGGGIEIANPLSPDGYGAMALAGERYSIHDITVDDVDARRYNGPGTLVQVLNSWPANVLNNVSINHITGFPDPKSHLLTLLDLTSKPQMWAFTFTNNIVGVGAYPIWSAGGGTGNCAASDIPIVDLPMCFSRYTFSSNALIGTTAAFPPSKWPSGNYFTADANAVQFVNYNNANGGNYQLLPSSPFKNAASDGTDLGADIGALQAAIAGVY